MGILRVHRYPNCFYPNPIKVVANFRATGEGHGSSIVFRSGIIDRKHNLCFNPFNNLVEMPGAVKQTEYNKNCICRNLTK